MVYTVLLGQEKGNGYFPEKVQSQQAVHKTPRPRSKEDTLPSRSSTVRNMITPMRSERNLSKPTVRTAEFLSGNRMLQEAKASSRKATGSHNRLDREPPTRKGADVEQEALPTEMVKPPYGYKKVDAGCSPVTVSSHGKPKRWRPRPSSGAQEPCAVKVCAMSRTEEIATTGGRSSRQMTPRRTTYLTLKGGGDRSLLLTRGVAEDVYATALQRLSDRAKAGLPEPQCPGVEFAHPSVARLYADARESRRFNFCRRYALLVGRWLMKPFKGMSAEPTSLYPFRSDGTWDGLRGASPRATESQ